jgi:RimJ/RimL family protein N-acetyltransferase
VTGPTRYFKKLVGKRCYLSPINVEDAELYVAWLNDRDVAEGLASHQELFSIAREREILEAFAKRPNMFAIVEGETDTLIGGCALNGLNQVDRTAELGIFIGRKDLWGKGYGQEGVNLLTRFAFEVLNLNIVTLDVYEFNERAIRCYEKCGFVEYGRLPAARFSGGRYYDIISMYVARPGHQGT